MLIYVNELISNSRQPRPSSLIVHLRLLDVHPPALFLSRIRDGRELKIHTRKTTRISNIVHIKRFIAINYATIRSMLPAEITEHSTASISAASAGPEPSGLFRWKEIASTAYCLRTYSPRPSPRLRATVSPIPCLRNRKSMSWVKKTSHPELPGQYQHQFSGLTLHRLSRSVAFFTYRISPRTKTRNR